MSHKREFYIGEGATKVADKNSSAVVYLWEVAGMLCGCGFHGRAQKPDWNFRFRSIKERENTVKKHFERWQADKAYKASRKAEGRKLDIGDVLVSVWGYDQTNIDYYEVVELVGKTMVVVREIAQKSVPTENMQGKCIPEPGNYIGEPIRAKAVGERVKVNDVCHAHKEHPIQVVEGIKIFKARNWSAYA